MIENGQEYELSKQGVLTATGLLKLLPCARECPFGKACAEQYLSEESCTTAVDDFVSGTVYGSSGEKSIRGGEIHFTITDPNGRGIVANGSLYIARPGK